MAIGFTVEKLLCFYIWTKVRVLVVYGCFRGVDTRENLIRICFGAVVGVLLVVRMFSPVVSVVIVFE